MGAAVAVAIVVVLVGVVVLQALVTPAVEVEVTSCQFDTDGVAYADIKIVNNTNRAQDVYIGMGFSVDGVQFADSNTYPTLPAGGRATDQIDSIYSYTDGDLENLKCEILDVSPTSNS